MRTSSSIPFNLFFFFFLFLQRDQNGDKTNNRQANSPLPTRGSTWISFFEPSYHNPNSIIIFYWKGKKRKKGKLVVVLPINQKKKMVAIKQARVMQKMMMIVVAPLNGKTSKGVLAHTAKTFSGHKLWFKYKWSRKRCERETKGVECCCTTSNNNKSLKK